MKAALDGRWRGSLRPRVGIGLEPRQVAEQVARVEHVEQAVARFVVNGVAFERVEERLVKSVALLECRKLGGRGGDVGGRLDLQLVEERHPAARVFVEVGLEDLRTERCVVHREARIVEDPSLDGGGGGERRR